jgi:hypothetical protein
MSAVRVLGAKGGTSLAAFSDLGSRINNSH